MSKKDKLTNCYRCGDRAHVSGFYTAGTQAVVSKDAQKILNINTANPRKQEIACCIEHISPVSRLTLHSENAFKRYEYQFLNYILYSIRNISHIKMKSLNEALTVNNKGRRYDLYLSDVKISGNPSTILLIEVDEAQHWTKKLFEEDRGREQELISKYPNTKIYILRIRVGEKSEYSCVGKKDTCYVKDGYEKQFKKNMTSVEEYATKVFTQDTYGLSKHVYIDFSTNDGLIDFPHDMFTRKASPPKLTKKEKIQKQDPVDVLVNDIANMDLNNRCEAVKKDGNVCGRKRPCGYHDK